MGLCVCVCGGGGGSMAFVVEENKKSFTKQSVIWFLGFEFEIQLQGGQCLLMGLL